jgi:uncharacterized protein (TIGR02117 family)
VIEVAVSKVEIPERKTWWHFVKRWGLRCLGLMMLAAIGFAAVAWVLGNTPVNLAFQHAAVDDGIDILVIDNGVHVDLVIPVNAPSFRWLDRLKGSDFREFDPNSRYAVVGWGNRQFYMETETWGDLKIGNVICALAGMGDTVVHVDLVGDLSWFREGSRRIRLSTVQFQQLSEYLLASFKTDAEGSLIAIANRHYRNTDAFYEGMGHYHLFRTCNVWAGGGLKRAGVRVGYWTLTPGLVFACLPEQPPERVDKP